MSHAEEEMLRCQEVTAPRALRLGLDVLAVHAVPGNESIEEERESHCNCIGLRVISGLKKYVLSVRGQAK